MLLGSGCLDVVSQVEGEDFTNQCDVCHLQLSDRVVTIFDATAWLSYTLIS